MDVISLELRSTASLVSRTCRLLSGGLKAGSTYVIACMRYLWQFMNLNVCLKSACAKRWKNPTGKPLAQSRLRIVYLPRLRKYCHGAFLKPAKVFP